MNLLFTVYTIFHINNPFVITPMPSFYISPKVVLQSSQPHILVPVVTQGEQLSAGKPRGEDAPISNQPPIIAPQQPGYVATCPDGTPAQGSCETPEGPK